MSHRPAIGEFLQSRRSRITPADAGLPPGPGRRRVTGLRREELAQLAGISVDYYIRLEQGRNDSVSDGVLNAIATALRLGEDEQLHLYQLARPARSHQPASQRVRPGLRHLLYSLENNPAFVLGRRMDILAWNSLACALITDFDTRPQRERNLAWLVLLDEIVVRLYPDRELAVRNVVGRLRLDAGRHPDDPELAALVAELSAGSQEFRRLWASHAVSRKRHGIKQFDHPHLGEFELCYESLELPDDPDQVLIVYTAEPGSPAEAKLRKLTDGGWPAADQD